MTEAPPATPVAEAYRDAAHDSARRRQGWMTNSDALRMLRACGDPLDRLLEAASFPAAPGEGVGDIIWRVHMPLRMMAVGMPRADMSRINAWCGPPGQLRDLRRAVAWRLAPDYELWRSVPFTSATDVARDLLAEAERVMLDLLAVTPHEV